MAKSRGLLFGMMLYTMFSLSCGKSEPDSPTIPNEEEIITSLRFSLTPMDGGASVQLSFLDLDGDGGDAPFLSADTLATNASYMGVLTLLNELVNPAQDIGAEIGEEAEDHQFFFESSFADVNIDYQDMDQQGLPIGLMSVVKTGDEGSGTIKITLRHEPDKSAIGVSMGDITNAGGETDIEVTFHVEVR